jgi:hypothetical protein
MSLKIQHGATCVLLVVYGAISLLGHALHWLSPQDHLHHPVVAHSSHVALHAHGNCGHHHHECDQAKHKQSGDTALAIRGSCGDAHLHVCDICAFLDQVKGQHAQLTAQVISHQLVAAASLVPQRAYSSISLGLHAPRGPPLGII